MEITYEEYLKDFPEDNKDIYHREFINEAFAVRQFTIDTDYEGWLDSSGLYLDLLSTNWLCEIADNMRMSRGFTPFFREDENGNIDDDAWYDFRILFKKNGRVEVYFTVDGSEEDNHTDYDIELTDEEQDNIFLAVKNDIHDLLHYEIKRVGARFEITDLEEN